MALRSSNGLLKTGVIGSAIAAICCFTPVLTVTLGVIGLGAITGYLDYVLLPALAVFVGITIYALVRRRPNGCDDSCTPNQRGAK
jgi:hypothetical protein